MHKSIFTEHRNIVLISAFISLLISVWCVYLDPIINNDGVQYLKAAQRIANGQFSDLITTYKWPFYPFLIALLKFLLPLNIEQAAHFVNAGLAAILVIAFLGLVYELGADKKTIIAAATVILLYPTVNELRSELIRDIGYVAFYLYSITFLLRYFKNCKKRDLYGWLVCTFLSILFRIEGVALLFAWPLVKFFLMEKGQNRNILLCLFSLFALVILVFIFLLWSSTAVYQQEASLSDGFFVYVSEAANQIFTDLNNRILLLQKYFLEKFSAKYAYTIYVFTLLLVLFTETIATITLFYFILSIVSVKKKLTLQVHHERITIYFLIGINLTILLFFTSARLFLTDRYALSLSVTVLALAPSAIIYFISPEQKDRNQKRWISIVICVFVVGLGIDGLSDSTHKHFVKEAGLWLKKQSPSHEKLLTNSRILAYYSGHNTEGHWRDFHWSRVRNKILRKKWHKYDYMAIKIRSNNLRDQRGIYKHTKLKPHKIFTNSHGDSMLIYKIEGHRE